MILLQFTSSQKKQYTQYLQLEGNSFSQRYSEHTNDPTHGYAVISKAQRTTILMTDGSQDLPGSADAAQEALQGASRQLVYESGLSVEEISEVLMQAGELARLKHAPDSEQDTPFCALAASFELDGLRIVWSGGYLAMLVREQKCIQRTAPHLLGADLMAAGRARENAFKLRQARVRTRCLGHYPSFYKDKLPFTFTEGWSLHDHDAVLLLSPLLWPLFEEGELLEALQHPNPAHSLVEQAIQKDDLQECSAIVARVIHPRPCAKTKQQHPLPTAEYLHRTQEQPAPQPSPTPVARPPVAPAISQPVKRISHQTLTEMSVSLAGSWKDPKQKVRALRMLLADPDKAEFILDRILHEIPGSEQAVINGLLFLPPEKSETRIQSLAFSHDEAVRFAVYNTIAPMQDLPHPRRLDAPKTPWYPFLEVFTRDLLERGVNDVSRRIRTRTCACAFAAASGELIEEALLQGTSDIDPEHQTACILALGTCPSDRALQHLRHLFEQGTMHQAEAAARSITQRTDARETWLFSLSDPRTDVRFSALYGLAQYAQHLPEEFLQRVESIEPAPQQIWYAIACYQSRAYSPTRQRTPPPP